MHISAQEGEGGNDCDGHSHYKKKKSLQLIRRSHVSPPEARSAHTDVAWSVLSYFPSSPFLSPPCMHILFSHPKHIVNLKCKWLPLSSPPPPFCFFFLPPITVPLMRCKICALMTEKLFRSGGELIGFNHSLHPSGYARQQTTSSWCLIRHIVRHSSSTNFHYTRALFSCKVFLIRMCR